MSAPQPLRRELLGGSAPEMAAQLLNKLLVSTVGGVEIVGRIVEVEAYDEDDPASHTFRGRTDRNAVMFGPPGRLYVYLSYGIHHCANVVVGADGRGEAVLIRALSIESGIDAARVRRGRRADRELADGPGKSCQALGVTLGHNGVDICVRDAPVRVADDGVAPPADPLVGPRIGISKAVDVPWRFRVPAR